MTLPAVLVSLLLFGAPLDASGAPGAHARKGPPKAGELRVGIVGWSKGEKRLAVSIEKLVDRDRDAPPRKKGAKATRRKVELTVGVFACPGFEMQEGHGILDEEAQGSKARATGWKRVRSYLGDDDFAAAGLTTDPAPLKLTPGPKAPPDPKGAEYRLFDLPKKLSAGPGARLELTVLEGNPVLTLLRPEAKDGAIDGPPPRLKLHEYDAGSFELAEARCRLEVSPKGSCLVLLCAQGGEKPYLGAYLLESRRLRVKTE